MSTSDKVDKKTVDHWRVMCKHRSPGPIKFQPGETCKAGVDYYALARIAQLGRDGCACRLPCQGGKDKDERTGLQIFPCEKYEVHTEDEVQEMVREMEHCLDCMTRGVSSCCEAEIDKSHLIKEGPHKGHGRAFCSKCQKCVYVI